MKTVYNIILLMLTCSTLTVQNGTVYGQSSTPCDSCVCYTDAQDTKCILCLLDAPKKDTIIQAQHRLITHRDSIIVGLDRSVEILTESNERKGAQLAALSIDLGKCRKRRNRLLVVGIGGGLLGGLFIGNKLVH